MMNQNNSQVHQIPTEEAFDEYLNSSSIINKLLLVHVELDQVPVCQIVNKAVLAISGDPEFMGQLAICRLNADHFYDLLNTHNVHAVPTVLFYHRTKVIDRVNGFNQSDLLRKVKLHINTIGVIQTTQIQFDHSSSINHIENKIKQLFNTSSVILFMEGIPASPQCGFSRQCCHILDEHKIKYDYFDVLADHNVCEQLQKRSNWNTYPQLYVDGEFIAGLDVMKQMAENGDFKVKLKQQETKQYESDTKGYLKRLIDQAPLMLFIKGTQEAPQCGFTKELIDLLSKVNITDYGTFDILQDENVRQKLKEYSSWETYPQIYVNGQFIGGLDIVKQMYEEGTLIQALTGKEGVAV